jgi:glutathione S-transferase
VSVPILWTSTFTSGSLAHQVACVSGVPFEARFISLRAGDHKKPDFLTLNAKGEVPALQLADGTVITEIPAIVFWFAESAPDSGLLPRDATARAKGIEWLAWCHWTMGRSFAAAFNPGYFGDDNAATSIRAAALKRVGKALTLAEDTLRAKGGTLLATPAPSAPDIYLSALASFAGMLKQDIANLAAVNALMARVAAMPGVAAAVAREKAHG